MPFLDSLHIVKLVPGDVGYHNGEEYRLTKPLRYFWTEEDKEVYADEGDITDFGSIPPIIPDLLLNDHGRIARPATLHDSVYHAYLDYDAYSREIWEGKHGTWTRKEADLLLRDSAKDEGINWLRRWTIWAGVRLNFVSGRKWGKS